LVTAASVEAATPASTVEPEAVVGAIDEERLRMQQRLDRLQRATPDRGRDTSHGL
jgi:hypothetical protein